jgi:hypothetical protein
VIVDEDMRLVSPGDHVIARGYSFEARGIVVTVDERFRRRNVRVLITSGEFDGRHLYFTDGELRPDSERSP